VVGAHQRQAMRPLRGTGDVGEGEDGSAVVNIGSFEQRGWLCNDVERW
jgi:hypothetical protein